jgi:hypothetical protein
VAASREALQTAFSTLPAFELTFNGGLYMLTVAAPDQMNVVLKALVEHNIPVKYARDISQSTRRLFI